MRTSAALLLTLSTLIVQGQVKKDSLWNVYHSSSSTVKARMNALYAIGEHSWLPGEPDSLIAYGTALQELARAAGDRNMEAAGLTNVGGSLQLQQHFTEADSCLQRALDLLTPDADPILKARIWNNQGLVAQGKGLHDAAMDLNEKALAVATDEGDDRLRAALLSNRGLLLLDVGDVAGASELFTTSLQIAEERTDSSSIASSLANLGRCYAMLGDRERGKSYQLRAAEIFERTGNGNVPRPYLNIASLYLATNLDSAFAYAEKAAAGAERVKDHGVLAMTYGLRAMIFRNRGMLDSALVFQQRGARLAEKSEDSGFALRLQLDMAMTLADQHRMPEAIAKAKEVIRLARERSNLQAQSLAWHFLYSREQMSGHYKEALDAYERHMAIEDSIKREQNERETIRQEYRYGYEKQALTDSLSFAAEKAVQVKEIQKQKVIRNGFVGGFALVALFAGVFFVQRNRISKARKRSDELLLNILPEEVAEELKMKGEAEAKHFDSATILFTDFKGFTQASEKMSPQDLVEELNTCFRAFDGIITARDIEKIKTIGDAYMCAGGLPDPKSSSPGAVVHAALEMQAFMKARRAERDAQGKPAFEMRVGIHTGPVVAGIVGVKKFQYDIWGDTVNTASRMESSGEVGQVNISEATYELVKNDPGLAFTSRGKVQAKGKGEMEMYFVERSA